LEVTPVNGKREAESVPDVILEASMLATIEVANTEPSTCNFCVGVIVPIPTFPFEKETMDWY
jgi:hypothetical protein